MPTGQTSSVLALRLYGVAPRVGALSLGWLLGLGLLPMGQGIAADVPADVAADPGAPGAAVSSEPPAPAADRSVADTSVADTSVADTSAAEPPQALSQEEANLAKQLANPVASLISVPFQFNYDQRIGPREEVQRATLNIQPVVPIKLSSDWNLISRTILPVVNAQGAAGPGSGQPNFGDTLQSLFLSPARPGPKGVIWGVGPVALVPTATAQLSGLQQWGLGPTGVALVQRGPWTVGALANHLWSVANNGSKANLNATFVQPFVSYTTRNAWTISLNTESSYDWVADRWAVPINLSVGKVTKLGNQLLSLGAGVRYWVDGPESGPHGWGVRAVATLLFPTR